ncbi:MAG: glutaredoxin-like protein NrdH [Salana multivorans]|nr:glutaredoxin-like protein NrdH [Salana multivorans]MBN8883045.1 glutaredoxin-like protein NrdH [Salana multivorans]OJX94525.1 MAG: hypothetical protein BGO96_16175 [Micrococcales bacterium 73-15]
MRSADRADERPVTVYTKPDCVQCDATKRALHKYEIPFIEMNLSDNMDVLDRLKAAGWMRAPIVETADGQMWSGFRPDKIRDLASPKASRAPGAEWSRSSLPRSLPVRL